MVFYFWTFGKGLDESGFVGFIVSLRVFRIFMRLSALLAMFLSLATSSLWSTWWASTLSVAEIRLPKLLRSDTHLALVWFTLGLER